MARAKEMVTKKDLTKLTKELTKVVKESMRGGKATAAERVAAEKAVEVAVNYQTSGLTKMRPPSQATACAIGCLGGCILTGGTTVAFGALGGIIGGGIAY